MSRQDRRAATLLRMAHHTRDEREVIEIGEDSPPPPPPQHPPPMHTMNVRLPQPKEGTTARTRRDTKPNPQPAIPARRDNAGTHEPKARAAGNPPTTEPPTRRRQEQLPTHWYEPAHTRVDQHGHATHTPPPTPRPKTNRGAGPTLTIATQNVRGIQSNKQDVLAVLNTHCPDILLVTETRLMQAHKHSKHARGGYDGYHSWVSSTPERKAGLLLLLHHSVTLSATVRHRSLPAHIQGYLMSTTITFPSSTPLELIGVYLPHDDPDNTRATILQYLEHTLYPNLQPQSPVILLGDANATLRTTGRSTLTEYDRDLDTRRVLDALRLYPLQSPLTKDTPSYWAESGKVNSRIDHILGNAMAKTALRRTTVGRPVYKSDHATVLATLEPEKMKITVPKHDASQLPQPGRTVIAGTPTTAQIKSFQDAIACRHGPALTDLADGLDMPPPGTTLDDNIQGAYERLDSILRHIQAEQLPNHLPTQVITPHQPRYKPRAQARQRAHALRTLATLRMVPPAEQDQPATHALAETQLAFLALTSDELAGLTVRQARQLVKEHVIQQDKLHSTYQRQQAQAWHTHMYETKPKTLHQALSYDPDTPKIPPLRVLHTTTNGSKDGGITSYGPDIVSETETHFRPLLQDPCPGESEIPPYPFTQPQAKDSFTLSSPTRGRLVGNGNSPGLRGL